MGGQADGRADERTGADNGRTSGQADRGGQKHGRADRRMGQRTSGQADGGRRADDGFPKVKLPI